jgi:hypothetical protein
LLGKDTDAGRPSRALRPQVGQMVLWRARTMADARALEFFTRPWVVSRILNSEPTRNRRSVRSLLLVPRAADDRLVPGAARWVPEEKVWWVAPV